MRMVLALAVCSTVLLLALASGRRSRAEGAGRVVVPSDAIRVDDGDSVRIEWPEGAEIVRILGIDTPETFHPQHDIPYAQPFGEEAAGFLRGCLAVAGEVSLLRSGQKDPHGRTLAYLYFGKRNYSVLVIEARLAVQNVSHFGDNGLPEPAAEVLAAAKRSGPVAFEAPHRYRKRMRAVAEYLRSQGRYPCEEER